MTLKSGGWPSVGLIYLYGVLGSASLSKVIPLQADLAQHVGASVAQYALLIALLSVPPAFLATVGGSLVDRIGARTTLIVASCVGALANFLYLQGDSILAFEAIRIFEGFVLIGLYAAAPGLIMATTSNQRRGRAMAFYSTYTPVGISLGLVLSGAFAGTEQWRGGYAIQCGLFIAMALVGTLLPKPDSPAVRAARPSLLSTYAQIGPLRLGLTFGALVIMGFGISTIFPTWYASHQGVSIGAAASLLAVANLSMIVGGLISATALGAGFGTRALFAILAVCGLAASIGIFAPGVSALMCTAALVAWLVASGRGDGGRHCHAAAGGARSFAGRGGGRTA